MKAQLFLVFGNMKNYYRAPLSCSRFIESSAVLKTK